MKTSAAENVGELMTGDLVALGPLDPMDRARTILDESGLHAIPVIEHDRAFGMVTLADCAGRQPDELLGDVMSGPPVTIDVGASVSDAARLMRDEYVHHLIVTRDRDQQVVGMLSTYDLLSELVDHDR